MNAWNVRIVSFAAALACAACNSGSQTADGGMDADSGAALDATDTVVPSDGGDVLAQPDAPGLWPTGGEVSVTVADFGSGPSVSAAAAFWNPSSGGTGVECSYRAEGSCTVRACTPRGNTVAPNAGAITMSVDGVTQLTLMPDTSGLYASAGHGVAPWMAGAMITFSAAGADVGSFSSTLVAPAPLTVISPDPMAASVDVSRANGFTATWMPGDGTVRVSVRQQRQIGTSALQGGVTVECFFSRSAGTGTVPPSLLSDFVAASGTTPNAEVLIFAVAPANVVVGDASVLVMANAGGLYTQGVVQ